MKIDVSISLIEYIPLSIIIIVTFSRSGQQYLVTLLGLLAEYCVLKYKQFCSYMSMGQCKLKVYIL